MTERSNAASATNGDTWFHKALKWRVHDPDEAAHIASTHHRRAAETRSRGHGWEIQAQRHDDMASICEAHAAALQQEAGAVR